MTAIEMLEQFIDEASVLDRWNNIELAEFLEKVEKALLAIFREETEFEIQIRAIRENLPTDPNEKVQERWDYTIVSVEEILNAATDHIRLIENTIPKQLPAY